MSERLSITPESKTLRNALLNVVRDTEPRFVVAEVV